MLVVAKGNLLPTTIRPKDIEFIHALALSYALIEYDIATSLAPAFCATVQCALSHDETSCKV